MSTNTNQGNSFQGPGQRERAAANLLNILAGLRKAGVDSYAIDLGRGILNADAEGEPLPQHEADTLFRTMVLDEGIDIQTSARAYVWAMTLCGGY